MEGVRAAAASFAMEPRDVMAFCLERDIWPLRFARNRGVLDASGQRMLLLSRVAIIGCGGLGGHVATLLARAGIGAFTVCDPDVFDESNLNRQLLCRENNLGANKALAARDELALVASHADIRAHPIAVTPANLPEILRDARIVADCLDSLRTRRHLAEAAGRAGIPFVHGAVAGDEGFVMLSRPGRNAMETLYGTVLSTENTAERQTGVPSISPAVVAAFQANLVIRELVGKLPEEDSLLHLDCGTPLLEIFSL